ncbi:MAG: 2-C-methyl-D-erythritol 2,4-cyclodiphosphate synthase [Treponemataceae bacterium]|nr:2-C-methyl-D-erythritol 2,4-cyclodiphosphate synthase [Treponemataceae bacterium]
MQAILRATTFKNRPLAVVLVAAGSSARMGIGRKKEYLPLGSGTVLSAAARRFLESLPCRMLAVAVPPGGSAEARAALFSDPSIQPLLDGVELLFVDGGASRQASVRNALEAAAALPEPPEFVLIHDGARPFVPARVVVEVAEAMVQFGAAAPGIPPVDTQKLVDADGFVSRHLRRAEMAAVQTPQGFSFAPLLEAHRSAARDGREYTDDAEIWGAYVGRVKVVAGDSCNRKITFASDYDGAAGAQERAVMKDLRTGLGYDIHRLTAGRRLLLGGVDIPADKGEDGHSDGDALLHAVADAVLGAAGLGDIGSFFPPEDMKWKDADSVELLRTVWRAVRSEGWNLGNLDCVVKLERPKLLPYRQAVVASIAAILDVPAERVFVKAKTGEALDSVGSGSAVEAWCTCLLVR